jgi:hypothetical protein
MVAVPGAEVGVPGLQVVLRLGGVQRVGGEGDAFIEGVPGGEVGIGDFGPGPAGVGKKLQKKNTK